jgi:hypothetical protein
MDLDDRVVHVGQRVLIDTRQQRYQLAKSDQCAGRDRVQLPDMPEAERPQERPESRWCVTGVEDPAHPAVPQDGHVVDAVRPGDHPRDQRGDLHTGVRTLVRRDRQQLICQRL